MVQAKRAQLGDRGDMALPDGVELCDEGRDAVGVLPVAGAELVLLGIQILLAALARRYVLNQLVTAVHPPRRAGDRRQHGAQAERRGPAVLQNRVQDVRRVDPEVGPEEIDQLGLGQLVQVLAELPFGGAPGEVRV